MAVISATIKVVDLMSSALEKMSDYGEKALEKWESAGEAADEALSRAADGAEEMAESADGAASSTDYWTDALGNYDKSAMEAVYSTEELVEMGYKTEDALSDAADAADDAAKQIEDVGEESEAAGKKSEKFGEDSKSAVQSLNSILTTAGIVIALKEIGTVFIECSDAAAEFETQLAKVSTIADTSQASMDTLSSEITDLSMDTGQAVNDLTDATYQALSAGVETANAVSFAGTATELAVGGFTEAATAVDVLTTALNAYNLETDQATEIADMLVTTQNLGKTTVDELATSVGKVIPLASAYGVEMDNLSTAYAVMTANGIATAESTTYLKSMLTELGDSSSTVAGVLEEETGQSFAELTESGYSLGDVLEVLGDSVDGNTTKFNEMWSSTEAGVGALSLFNSGAERYNTVLNEMQDSAGATAAAYEAMTDTTEYTEQRLSIAAENLGISFGNVLNPALNDLREAGADVLNWMSEVVDEHPAVAAAAVGLTVGVTTLAAALAVYEAKQTIASIKTAASAVAHIANAGAATADAAATVGATVATEGFTAALLANPIGLIVAGVAALATGIYVLAKAMSDEDEEREALTATSREQYDQLQDLNAEYEKAVEEHGEISTEADRLRYQMDDLNDSFEANKQTVEEFTAECDALAESHDKLIASYEESTTEIKNTELGTLALIQKLEDLATSSDTSTTAVEQMEAVIAQLNEDLPGLSLSYEDVTTNIDSMVEALKKAAEQQAQDELKSESQETYVALLKEQAQLEDEITKAEANLNAEREAQGMYYDEVMDQWTNSSYTEDSPWASWTTDLDEYNEALDTLNVSYAENQDKMKEIERQWEDIAAAEQEAAKAQVSYEDAVSTAISSTQDAIKELAIAYDDAYDAALSSIQGQYSLWDEAAGVVATSADTINSNLESQATYWQNYNSNLENLADRSDDIEGLSDVIASFADGSSDSVNAIAGMADASDEDLAAMVQSWQKLQEEQDNASDSIAQLETDFADKMDEIEQDMAKSIGEMTMDTEAKKAAKDTIQAYIDEIESMTDEAHDAAAAVAAAASSALGGTVTTGVTVEANAGGTTNAADVFIAGEDGPELIVGAGGSTVFPADETERILDAAGSVPVSTSVPADYDDTSQNASKDNLSEEKKITIEIAGSGEISVDSSVSKDSLLDLMITNIRPILMNVLKQEVFEEGDLSYDF
jgi:TP901 family phage tail tape measure protein